MTTLSARTSLFSRRTFRQGAISALGSVKIKLLLSCCIVLTLFAFASRAASFMGWKQHHAAHFGRSSHPRNGYTLLINTWKRNDLLKRSISHYSSCPGLVSIHIVWSEPDPPSDSLNKFLNHVIRLNSKNGRRIELKYDINEEDSLNNRFKEIKNLKTDALFSIDDDVIFPCRSMELAFSVWQSAPDTMVGFVPRVHWVEKLKGEGEKFIYGGWWSVWWTGTYSMVLSKAAFFHKKYLSMYTYQMPASIREYTSKNRNCEDIAMSFLVANATGAPPVWVTVARTCTNYLSKKKDTYINMSLWKTFQLLHGIMKRNILNSLKNAKTAKIQKPYIDKEWYTILAMQSWILQSTVSRKLEI